MIQKCMRTRTNSTQNASFGMVSWIHLFATPSILPLVSGGGKCGDDAVIL